MIKFLGHEGVNLLEKGIEKIAKQRAKVPNVGETLAKAKEQVANTYSQDFHPNFEQAILNGWRLGSPADNKLPYMERIVKIGKINYRQKVTSRGDIILESMNGETLMVKFKNGTIRRLAGYKRCHDIDLSIPISEKFDSSTGKFVDCNS